MAEIPFEYLLAGIEGTPGTAVNPSHYLNLDGMLTLRTTDSVPDESRGTRSARYRKKRVKEWGELVASGPLDFFTFPFMMQSLVRGGSVTPSTPTNGVLTRDWLHSPLVTGKAHDFYSVYFGDPNTASVFRGLYGMINSLTISADASGDDNASVSINGITQNPAKISPPSVPTLIESPLASGVNMQVFIDTSLAIGTTPLLTRIVSSNHTITNGLFAKYLAAGPAAALTYSRPGYGDFDCIANLVVDMEDFNEYDLAAVADTVVKLRVIYNGPLIESVTPDYYYGVQIDSYGTLKFTDFGELEGVNRTVQLMVESEEDAVAAVPFAVTTRNNRTTL